MAAHVLGWLEKQKRASAPDPAIAARLRRQSDGAFDDATLSSPKIDAACWEYIQNAVMEAADAAECVRTRGLVAVLILISVQIGNAKGEQQSTYQTKGIVLNDWDIADWAGASYWEQQVASVLDLIVDPRLKTSADERDAVLAAIWNLKSEPVAAATKLVTIIRKPTGTLQPLYIAYLITIFPPAGAKKAKVEARFISEGLGTKPFAASPPAAGMLLRLPVSYTHAGLPQNIVKYWVQHSGELQSILSWIGSSTSPKFDQMAELLNASAREHGAQHLRTGPDDL